MRVGGGGRLEFSTRHPKCVHNVFGNADVGAATTDLLIRVFAYQHVQW